MRKLLIVVLCFVSMGAAATLNAQSQSVQATVSAGASSEHLYVAVGQPFFTQDILGDYELSLGVAEAQWVRDTVYDVITYSTPYTDNGFNLNEQTSSHKDSVYIVNGGIYRYDLLRTLYLIVCDSVMADIQESNLSYDVLAVSGHCWTKQNLRTPVEGATAYRSSLNATVPQVYGLLYPQTAAQTLCPDGWHLPTGEEVAALSLNPATTLRSTDGWINGDYNTNSTGFTAYPAGLYNAAARRFEGLGSETNWWVTGGMTMDGTTPGTVETRQGTSLQIDFFCDTPRLNQSNPNDKLSVRCVKTNVWPD